MQFARLPVIALLLTVLTGSAPVCACSVPVFRYALEQWQPDNYECYLFYRGELGEAETALAKSLEPRALSETSSANMRLTLVNLDEEVSPKLTELWEAQKSKETPLLVVQLPHKIGARVTIWSGKFTKENVAALLDSPARREIAQRILKGDSVVWVLLESGEKEVDDQAFKVLERELLKLQAKITLPEVDEADVSSLSIDPKELKLKFSAVRVSRDDPKERFLVEMLMHVEPDLQEPEFADKTMAFPVFGRGRALYSLVGEGIADVVIEDACRFLAGACQCTVKAQNPGVDLLISLDWNKFVEPTLQDDRPLPPLAGLSGFGVSDLFPEKKVAAATTSDATETEPEELSGETVKVGAASPRGVAVSGPVSTSRPSAIGMNALFVGLALLLIVAVGTVILAPRQNS